MDPTRQESCMNLDVQVGDAPLWWHGGEHINFPNAKQITQKHVRFNDQVQFILPAHDDEVWEQDDIALVQTETKFHSSVVSAIKELVGDVDSVQVVVWCIGPQGQGSNISKTVELQKHQEQHWCDAIAQAWNAEGVMGRADVSIVTPQPIDRGDRCAEHCIHAIVWQKVDGKAPILIDRIVDGVPQDRSSWMVNSRTVLDIFVHVGWDRYADDPDYNCVLDDDGVWLTPDVPVEVFDGFLWQFACE